MPNCSADHRSALLRSAPLASLSLALALLLLSTALAQPQLPPAHALKAYFSLDTWKSPGVFSHDDSRNGFGFQLLNGGPSNVDTTSPRLGTGAISVTGAEFAALGAPVQFTLETASTVSFWARTTATSAADEPQYLLTTLVERDARHVSIVFADGGVGVTHDGPGGPVGASGVAVGPTRSINDGLWHHIALTVDGAAFMLYVDGGVALSGTFASLPAQAVDTMDAPSVFMCGHPPTGWSSPTAIAGFVGSVDNIRLYNVALSAEEVARLFVADETVAGPVPFPSGWAAPYTLVKRSFGSHPGGSFDFNDTIVGYAAFDTIRRRAVRTARLATEPVSSATTIALFTTGDGRGEMEFEVQANGACKVTELLLCPLWAASFACIPGRQSDCVSPSSPSAGFYTHVDWHGPPALCEYIPDGAGGAPDTGVRCTTGFSQGSTIVETSRGGAPRFAQVTSCTPTPQSSSCSVQTQTFDADAMSLQDPSDAVFDVLNAACFAEMSTEQCARFCNGHGTCSTAHPGTCACDAQWSGLQCEVSTVPEECIKGEWSAWSTCSTPCGTGTQSRSAAYVPATPNTVCQAQAVMQERQCNTHPCGDVGCSGCAAESAGPCRAPHNNVCYSFYAGTTVCPAGTAACSNQCTDCAAGTEGPCHHLADETCVPYGTTMAGTGQCAAGTVSCSEAPVPDGFCHGCWPGTSGRCQQANSVCWALLPSGECPVGTAQCSTSTATREVPTVAAIDVELHGVAISTLEAADVALVQQALAATAGVPVQAVQLQAVRSSTAVTPRSTDQSMPSSGMGPDSGSMWYDPASPLGSHNGDMMPPSNHAALPATRVAFAVWDDGDDVRAQDAAAAVEAGVASGRALQELRAAIAASDMADGGSTAPKQLAVAEVSSVTMVQSPTIVDASASAGGRQQGGSGGGSLSSSIDNSGPGNTVIAVLCAGGFVAAVLGGILLVVLQRRWRAAHWRGHRLQVSALASPSVWADCSPVAQRKGLARRQNSGKNFIRVGCIPSHTADGVRLPSAPEPKVRRPRPVIAIPGLGGDGRRIKSLPLSPVHAALMNRCETSSPLPSPLSSPVKSPTHRAGFSPPPAPSPLHVPPDSPDNAAAGGTKRRQARYFFPDTDSVDDGYTAGAGGVGNYNAAGGGSSSSSAGVGGSGGGGGGGGHSRNSSSSSTELGSETAGSPSGASWKQNSPQDTLSPSSIVEFEEEYKQAQEVEDIFELDTASATRVSVFTPHRQHSWG